MDNRIRELRIRRGISQEILSGQIGVTQQTISKIENDKYKAPTDLLINIADYFEVSVDYLLGRTEIKRNWENQQRVEKRLDEYYELVTKYERLNKDNRKTIEMVVERLVETQNKG